MLSHPNSVIALGIVRHQELQAENARVRIAMTAVVPRRLQPRALSWMRIRLGSVLIRTGAWLQAEPWKPGALLTVFHVEAR
jgi:hypothetical protein